jgi:hypothetical protein
MRNCIQIKLSNIDSIFICSIRHKRYLLIKKEPHLINFLLITPEIENICIINKTLLLVKSTTTPPSFLTSLLLLKNACLTLKKKLVLKGLGFKIAYSDGTRTLNFKLGYSHLVFLSLPTGVDLVKIGKNYLIVSGVDPSLLGNFVTSIQRLRFPDSYKGKGFWKKYEKKSLKLFKKK